MSLTWAIPLGRNPRVSPVTQKGSIREAATEARTEATTHQLSGAKTIVPTRVVDPIPITTKVGPLSSRATTRAVIKGAMLTRVKISLVGKIRAQTSLRWSFRGKSNKSSSLLSESNDEVDSSQSVNVL